MRAGDRKVLVGTELSGKTVGLIGLGRIARQVARRLQGFDVRILAYDVSWDEDFARSAGIIRSSLDELLQESDYVSLHAPLTDATSRLLNEQTIASMKRGAILINTARGELVDEDALLAALVSGHLGGAGLDVLSSERDIMLPPVIESLLALPNVVCTPHAAGSSREGLARSNRLAAECVLAALENRPLRPECVVVDGR